MPDYKTNHARIFGPKPKNAGGVYAMRGDQLVKNPARIQNRVNGPAVRGSMEAFISPVDGSNISTRTQLAEHHRAHGTTDMRDYAGGFIETRAKERHAASERDLKTSRISDIQYAIDKHS